MLKSVLEAAKRITFSVVLAIVLVCVMLFETPVQAAAATEAKYIESMVMVSADNTDLAKAKLPEGYVLINDPIYEGEDIRNGSTVRTYLAYKPTIDRNSAIVDIQAMHMTGGYGYEEYRAFLENQKTVSAQIVDGLKDAIKEFRRNLQAGKDGAKYAEKMLSYYVDDDYANDPKYGAPRSIADIFKDETTEDSVLVKIVMESNMDILGSIERLLTIACSDTASQTIIEYLNDPYYTFDKDMVETGVYNSYAADIINSLEDIQNSIRFFESCFPDDIDIATVLAEYDIQGQKIAELIDHGWEPDYKSARAACSTGFKQRYVGQCALNLRYMIDDFDDQHTIHFNIGRVLYGALNNTYYEGVKSDDIYSLYDLIMQHPISNGEGKEEYKYEDFYPLIAALTAGQRGMLKVGLSEILISQIIEKDTLMEYMSIMTDDENGLIKPADTLSIYAGVDRSVFTPDGIAMTSAAITRAKEKGDYTYGQREMTKEIQEIAKYAAMVSGAVVIAGTITYMAMSVGAAYFGLFSGTFESLGLMVYGGTFTLTTEATMSVNLVGGAIAPGVQALANSTAPLFAQGIQAVFLTTIGKIVGIVTAVAIAALIIAAAIYLIIKFGRFEDDQTYTAIPRILLSEETVYTGKLDDKGNKDTKLGYAYYYGVKNPELNENSKDPDKNSLANQVMDVANWSLHGLSREWIALYTCNDHKLAKEPILASSLRVAADPSSDTGDYTVKYFNSGNCNFEWYYQSMTASHDEFADKYLIFERAEPEKANSGSVFATGNSLGAAAIGAVVGACGATAITLLVQKKKKKEA